MRYDQPANDATLAAEPAADKPKSKFVGAIKHPVWATVGTLVAVAALVVTYFQVNQDAKPADVEVANVSFQSSTPIEAKSGGSDMPMVDWEQTTETATPIDIALKNNGGTPAHIVRIETRVLDAKTVTCNRQGGGAIVSAFYGVKVPYNPWTAQLSSDTVSTPIDYTVKASSVDRMVVTVGPEETGNGKAIVLAVQLRLIPEQGEPIELEPLALSQPAAVDNEVSFNSAFNTKSIDSQCLRDQADALGGIFKATKMQSPDVVRLRAGLQPLSDEDELQYG